MWDALPVVSQPPEPAPAPRLEIGPEPPSTVGAQPINASEVNNKIGQLMRDFVAIQTRVNQNQGWLVGADLTLAPYSFTADQETLLKSAVGTLDAGLDAIDMTFIDRVIGLV